MDITELRTTILATLGTATEEFNVKNKTEFKAPTEISDEQIIGFTRQAFRQRLHTQSFQKKNRRLYQAMLEKMKAKGINIDELMNGADVE